MPTVRIGALPNYQSMQAACHLARQHWRFGRCNSVRGHGRIVGSLDVRKGGSQRELLPGWCWQESFISSLLPGRVWRGRIPSCPCTSLGAVIVVATLSSPFEQCSSSDYCPPVDTFPRPGPAWWRCLDLLVPEPKRLPSVQADAARSSRLFGLCPISYPGHVTVSLSLVGQGIFLEAHAW